MNDRATVAVERLGLIALGVALETAAQPPGPVPAFVFLQDAPFLALLWHRGGVRWKRWAFLAAFVKFLVGLRWLSEVHVSLVLGASFVLALTFLAWGGLVRGLVRRRVPWLLVVPVTAVLQEMSQTVVMGTTGMPWPCRSLAFAAWPSFVGAASILGAYGLSALAALVAAWASGLPSLARDDGGRGERGRQLLRSGAMVAALVGLAAWRGGARIAELDARIASGAAVRTRPLVVVQGNVPQSLKNDRGHQESAESIFERHLRLTRDALLELADHREDPLAVLWPETMVPWPFLDPVLAAKFPEMWESEFNVLSRIREVVPEGMPAQFLLGVNRYFVGRAGPQDELLRHDTTDALLHVDVARVPPTLPLPDPKVPGWRPPWELVPARHDKVVLVPWGECTPGGELCPPLRRLRDAISIIPEITPGDPTVDPFFLGYVRPERPGGANREVLAGTIICFEIAFPARCRAWRDRGASVLLNAANYAWYGDTGMPAQVLALGRLRAAELAVAVAIAGNTGPTAILDPVGRVTQQVERAGRTQFVEGAVAGPLLIDPAYRTPYSRWGDLPWLLGGLALGVAAFLRRSRLRGAPSPGAGGAPAEPPSEPPAAPPFSAP